MEWKVFRIDGNNLLSVYDTIKGVREYCIHEQKPYLVECMTFRMRGHEEASGIKYVPPALLEEWAKKDPVKNFGEYLILQNVLTYSQAERIKNEIKEYIDSELKDVLDADHIVADTKEELNDVYAKQNAKISIPNQDDTTLTANRELRMIDAIKEGLHQSMDQHPQLILMGQDIAEYGGAFKITEGLVNIFGKEGYVTRHFVKALLLGRHWDSVSKDLKVSWKCNSPIL